MVESNLQLSNGVNFCPNRYASGSYGVNVCGYDNYKKWISDGWERTKELGPVLGPLHPIVGENLKMIKAVSKLDEISFHMAWGRDWGFVARHSRFTLARAHERTVRRRPTRELTQCSKNLKSVVSE